MYSSHITVGLMATGLITNLLYRYSTRSEGTLHIKDKYMYTRVSGTNRNVYASQQFTVVDQNDTLYTIPYSLLSFQFDAEDKWSKLVIGKTYQVKYWGIRQPMLGLYPRIDEIVEGKN